MTKIRTVLIDDHPLFRTGVAELLHADNCFELVAEAANGPDGLDMVHHHKPDLVLLDMNMKHMDGLAVLKKLDPTTNEICCVMLTMSNAEEDFLACMHAGAAGYLLKDMDPNEILSELLRAIKGDLAVSPELSNLLANTDQVDTNSSQAGSTITPREQEIIELVASGLSNKLIAQKLGISDATVKAHLRNLMAKLKLNSRLEVAIWCLSKGRSM